MKGLMGIIISGIILIIASYLIAHYYFQKQEFVMQGLREDIFLLLSDLIERVGRLVYLGGKKIVVESVWEIKKEKLVCFERKNYPNFLGMLEKKIEKKINGLENLIKEGFREKVENGIVKGKLIEFSLDNSSKIKIENKKVEFNLSLNLSVDVFLTPKMKANFIRNFTLQISHDTYFKKMWEEAFWLSDNCFVKDSFSKRMEELVEGGVCNKDYLDTCAGSIQSLGYEKVKSLSGGCDNPCPSEEEVFKAAHCGESKMEVKESIERKVKDWLEKIERERSILYGEEIGIMLNLTEISVRIEESCDTSSYVCDEECITIGNETSCYELYECETTCSYKHLVNVSLEGLIYEKNLPKYAFPEGLEHLSVKFNIETGNYGSCRS